MTLSRTDLMALVAEANLAPSVHNTQPSRWRLDHDGGVLLLEDSTRRLPVGDPLGRDAEVSHGAALEGFVLACAQKGLAVNVDQLPLQAGSLRPVARLGVEPGAGQDPLRAQVSVRRTYRGAFAPGGDAGRLAPLTANADAILVSRADGVARLAQLNDEASLRTYRDKAFRAELVSWMRLSSRHPRWALDGLNAEAMEMSGFEAAGAGLVLKSGIFETLDKAGVAGPLVSEAKVVRSAQAVVLFHRPEDEPPLETGRRFYRLWLEFTALGVAAAPMAVLADDAAARTAIAAAFSVPAGRRLITAFRLGVAPARSRPPKPRLPVEALIV
jgi:nitroreductase